ncbi:MAG: N-acetyltransferase family protein [Candidatus Bathyarchaeia archaeon]|jgi:phosphinothricin acetyltransferase
MVTLRKATIGDIEGITEIYNEAILNTTATFDTQPKTLEEQQKWFQNHQPYLILVAMQEGIVVGWASLSKWSDRCAYSSTAEASIYIRKEFRGKGIGSQLLRHF